MNKPESQNNVKLETDYYHTNMTLWNVIFVIIIL